MATLKFMKTLLYKSFLLVLSAHFAQALFKHRMQGVQEKAKGYFKSQFGKSSMNFMGLESSDYPGTNAEYRKINRDKWQVYYECLALRQRALEQHHTIPPEAKVAVVGGYVKLSCNICLSPKELSSSEELVEWAFAPVGSDALDLVEFSENVFVSHVDKSLDIYNLQLEQSGQYLCTLGYSLTAPYFLTVIENAENVTEVHSKRALNGPFPKQPEVVPEYNLVLNTDWGPWSGCNKCSSIGRRYKLGFCIITIEESQNQAGDKKRATDVKISEKDLEILKIFKYGVPCDSHILPQSVKDIPHVKNRKNEIMLGYCKEICKEEAVFEVKDKMGRIIERANNSAGIYSLAQGLPPIEPQVERRLQYEDLGKLIVLHCPGNLNSKAPIEWQIGGKLVVPAVIARESQRRIFISLTDRIHIKKAKKSDSNFYSCWQHKELAGTIRLVVEEKFKMNFNHHIMLLGMIIIMSTFLYVFAKAFLGRKYAKV